jgi:hypothetical protein
MFQIDRNEEATAYFDLAYAILECELGSHHERAMTVRFLTLGLIKLEEGF